MQEWRHSCHEGATVYLCICCIPKLQMEFLSSHNCKLCTRGKFTQRNEPIPKTIKPFCALLLKESRAVHVIIDSKVNFTIYGCNSLIPTQHRIANSALYLYITRRIVHGVGVVHAVMSLYLKTNHVHIV